MRRMVYGVLAVLSFVLAGCGRSPKATPLKGNPALVTFTEKSDDGQALVSVVDPQTGRVIMPPADYSEVAGDEYVVYGKRGDGIWTLAKISGEHIGTFEMLTPYKTNGTYYLGITYIFKTYYFPKADLVITTKNVHTEPEVLFAEHKGEWLALDYDGRTLSTLPESFTVIKDAGIPTKMWIAAPDEGEHPSCALYSLTGEMHRKLTPPEWDSLRKRLTARKELTESVSIATAEDFDQL